MEEKAQPISETAQAATYTGGGVAGAIELADSFGFAHWINENAPMISLAVCVCTFLVMTIFRVLEYRLKRKEFHKRYNSEKESKVKIIVD